MGSSLSVTPEQRAEETARLASAPNCMARFHREIGRLVLKYCAVGRSADPPAMDAFRAEAWSLLTTMYNSRLCHPRDLEALWELVEMDNHQPIVRPQPLRGNADTYMRPVRSDDTKRSGGSPAEDDHHVNKRFRRHN